MGVQVSTAFYNLAIKYKAARKQKQKKELLEKYLKIWWWKTLAWGYFKTFSLSDLRKALGGTPPITQIIKLKNAETRERSILLNTKSRLLKKISKDLRQLFNVYDVLAQLHDYRKEVP